MNKSLSTLSVIPHIASYVHWGFVIAALRTLNPVTSYNLLFPRGKVKVTRWAAFPTKSRSSPGGHRHADRLHTHQKLCWAFLIASFTALVRLRR